MSTTYKCGTMKNRIILAKFENLMAAIKEIQRLSDIAELKDFFKKFDKLVEKFLDTKPLIKEFRKKVKPVKKAKKVKKAKGK